MRSIKFIVIHCSAGPANQKTESIKDYWKRILKWNTVGYHKLISEDGTFETLATDETITNGVAGHNHNSIHFCYKGGWDGSDTRTEKQKETLYKLIKEYKLKYPKATVLGHRDLSPDLNKDGKISKNEWVKICPCFSVTEEYKNLNSEIIQDFMINESRERNKEWYRTESLVYTVRSGDTLSKIAQMYNTTVSELQIKNKLTSPDTIHIGQVLTIK